jgi:hypothetical protein
VSAFSLADRVDRIEPSLLRGVVVTYGTVLSLYYLIW